MEFCEKGRVLWFQSLFREFTLCCKIRIGLLGEVYHFSLLICYPSSFIHQQHIIKNESDATIIDRNEKKVWSEWLTLSGCPEKFDAVVEAREVLGGYSMENKEGEKVPTFKTLSLPLIIGCSLEKCAALQNGLAVEEKNPTGIANVIDFLKLY